MYNPWHVNHNQPIYFEAAFLSSASTTCLEDAHNYNSFDVRCAGHAIPDNKTETAAMQLGIWATSVNSLLGLASEGNWFCLLLHTSMSYSHTSFYDFG
jgi:hypothetical protein